MRQETKFRHTIGGTASCRTTKAVLHYIIDRVVCQEAVLHYIIGRVVRQEAVPPTLVVMPFVHSAHAETGQLRVLPSVKHS